MIKVFIDGSAGTTGLRIREMLEKREDISLIALPEQLRKDVAARRDAINGADAVFLCLPDDAAREAVGLVENKNTVVIDASGDGIDANGSIYMNGGEGYVNGPTSGADGALDWAEECVATGGTMVAVGSAGMEQGFSESSTQGAMLMNVSGAAGETLELEGRSFTVLGSLMHDNAYLEGTNSPESSFTFYYLVPLTVFDELFPGQSYRQLAVDIDHSQQASFEEYLAGYEQGLNRGISITLRSDYQENFESSRLNMVLILGMVGAVLLLIALLNFVNWMVTKTVSRRKEFAVYQSLGMTLGQLRRLVLLEGAFSALLLAVVLVPVTIAFAALVMPGYIANLSWVSVYTFDVTPLWIILPVAVALALLTPLLCLRFITKGTIQQRLGVTE